MATAFPPPKTPSEAQADAWVQRGFAHHQAVDSPAAEQAYRQALQVFPRHAVALQLLGLLLRRQGDLVQAEALMRQSLQVQPGQAHVWNNLGNLLLSVGRAAEAEAAFDQALALQPSYADAHYNRARALHQQARLPCAAAAVRAALAHSPQPTAAMLQLQAQIEGDQGRLKEALITVDRALQLAPDKPALLHNRATLLQRSHRHTEALHTHERALALGLDAADAHYNHGNTLQSVGQLEAAAAAYRRALAREPQHRLALLDLARLRWRQGDPDFEGELLQTAADHPASAVAPGVHANLLWRAERYADAQSAYAQALSRAPHEAAFHDGLGRCLVRLGQIEEGLAAQARAVLLAPLNPDLRTSLASSLLMARRPDAAEREAQVALSMQAEDQYAWSLLGLAWRVMGDAREAWLNDCERLVQVHDLPPPPGFDSMQTFCEQLTQELSALHHDRRAPVDQTLRNGTQTLGDIFEQQHPLVDALKRRISEAVGRYIKGLPQDMEHPFLRRRQSSWRYADSWSSRLGSGGFHTNHVHPHGWISSACYVAVPPAVVDGEQRAGWLQLGQPDIDVGLEQAARRFIQPQVGRLVLFPSMCWHGTTPFTDQQARLSIAFDVMPT